VTRWDDLDYQVLFMQAIYQGTILNGNCDGDFNVDTLVLVGLRAGNVKRNWKKQVLPT